MPIPRLLAIALAALVATIVGEAAVTAETTADPAKAVPADIEATATEEILFFPARGGADACGTGCSEWIAAEGKIDAGAAQRLRRLLTKLGHRRMPIYFHSPGGSIVGSIELGRLIRDQKLEVSVAHTIPLGCDRDKPLEKSCTAQKRSGQELESELDPAYYMCNSACVYAVAGGTVRLIPPGVKLAIHDAGFEKPLPRGAPLGTVKRMLHERIQQYLRDMGFDDALYKAAAAVPFESMKFLERDDLVRFGIDRRELAETAWQLLGRTTPAVSKRFFVRTASDPARYVEGALSVVCVGAQAIGFGIARQRGAPETDATGPRFIGISLGGQQFDLTTQVPSGDFDGRAMRLPASTLDAVGDGATIEVLGIGPGRHDQPTGSVTLSMHGFATAYAKLRKTCVGPAPSPVAVTPPGKPIPYVDPGSLRTLSAPAVLGSTGPAPPGPEPVTARPTPSAADLSAQSEPAQGCSLNIANEPKQVTGRVTGFLTDQQALERTRKVEALLGARISPAYVSLERVTVERDPQDGAGSTMAAIPEHMIVEVGDRVELNSRYRDQNLRCNFIPWTVNRLIEHVD
jgi:hypothetical protein